MTATITSPSKKKSFFSIRFISNISQNMKLLIRNMFFHLLCFPVQMGVVLREMYLSDHKCMKCENENKIDQIEQKISCKDRDSHLQINC